MPVDCLWITLWRSGPHLWQERDLLDTPRRHFRVSSRFDEAPGGRGIGQRVISGSSWGAGHRTMRTSRSPCLRSRSRRNKYHCWDKIDRQGL